MNKKELKKLIEIIKTGNKKEVNIAQKKIESNQFEITPKTFSIFVDEIKKFDEIKDVNHQMYFVNTLKYPIFIIGEDNLKFFTDFVLKTIQHPSGKVRQAIISAYSNLNWDIYNALEENFERKNENQKELKKIYAQNRKTFFNFVDKLYEIAGKHHEPKFKKYKYINKLPVGVYKSIQKLIYEEVFRSDLAEICYRKYFFKRDKVELAENKALDKEVERFLEKRKVYLSVDRIKNLVWHDTAEKEAKDSFLDFQKEIMEHFGDIKNEKDLLEVYKIILEIWNGYPHSSLDGKTPEQVRKETILSADNNIFSDENWDEIENEDVTKMLRKFSGGTVPKTITITVKYDPVLECLIGKNEEKMFLNELAPFNFLLTSILSSYPKIMERYKPHETSFLINGKPVEGYCILFDGDVVEFNVNKP